jgi:hypothetical protein
VAMFTNRVLEFAMISPDAKQVEAWIRRECDIAEDVSILKNEVEHQHAALTQTTASFRKFETIGMFGSPILPLSFALMFLGQDDTSVVMIGAVAAFMGIGTCSMWLICGASRKAMDAHLFWTAYPLMMGALNRLASQDLGAERKRERERESKPDRPESSADTLVNLASLVDKGLLTRDEFDAQKKKLLAPDASVTATEPEPTVMNDLQALEELKKAGGVPEDEYRRRKQELIDSI